jgi:ubiquinone/menaquinone biosynthesis C-methylase UbiE
MSNSDRSVPAAEYSKEYFLTECDGYTEYGIGKGTELAPRLGALWEYLSPDPAARVLDVGCGRGEMVVKCARNGVHAVGLDYSSSALELAKQAIERAEVCGMERWRSPGLLQGNCMALPFADESFDRAIMSDIVEHLYPRELDAAVGEIHRVLRTGGELLVHTMPNLSYYRYGYPLFRLAQRLRGHSLPADPRARYRFAHVHVNEQTPRSLQSVLARAGFSHRRVWLYDYRDYAQYGRAMQSVMRFLTGTPLIKRAFCDDIFGLARK